VSNRLRRIVRGGGPSSRIVAAGRHRSRCRRTAVHREEAAYVVSAEAVSAWPEPADAALLAGGPDLAWLASVLWPEADVRLSPKAPPPGRRVAEAYAVLPNAHRPRLLVPLSAIGVADAGARGPDVGLSRLGATRAVATTLAASPPRRSRAIELVVYFDREPRADELLTQHLRGVFDRPDAALVISIGRHGADLLPVVRAVGLDGDPLGTAKVGWSPATRALVANEAAVLRRWARARPRSFTVPDLVDEGRWRHHTVAVTSVIPEARRWTSWGRPPPVDVTREIARSGGIALAPLGSSPWWRSILGRARVGRAPVVLRWMNELHGRRLVWLGTSHGDWAPESMQTLAGRLHVWGWQWARDGTPLGLDPVGFAFRTAMRGRPDPSRASRRALRRGAAALRALGVPREDDPLVMACCLADLIVRSDPARGERRVDDGPAVEAMLEELSRWVARA
jgi:hypothetical protein